jgi:glutamate-5-semialdehyde dehydrogenase
MDTSEVPTQIVEAPPRATVDRECGRSGAKRSDESIAERVERVHVIDHRPYASPMTSSHAAAPDEAGAAGPRRLRSLHVGQEIPFGGDRVAVVGDDLAAAFRDGDRLIVVHESGDLLHLPAADHAVATAAVDRASAAFRVLAACDDAAITRFFEVFADLLADDHVFAAVLAANEADVASARARARSTTRLVLTPAMRAGMIAGLRTWQHTSGERHQVIDEHRHDGWTVETRRAPLGVVGFVFEGRPNVFADATGVLRTGNTAVFRIGSDALGTARAIMTHAVEPALRAAGLPVGSVELVDSVAHAAGWALFADTRLGLAVARGSGRAVAQLGAVARQHGVPASLHGTGGAWMIVLPDADRVALAGAVRHSLDRKVCNTLNVVCVVRDGAAATLPTIAAAGRDAAAARGTRPVFHLGPGISEFGVDGLEGDPIDRDELGTEWEWEEAPEVSVVLVDDLDDAVALFARTSPRFVASLLGGTAADHDRFEASIDAPFVGDGFTRWVDGQYAFDRPELGLSNWQSGRLLARGGVLSGDSVHTVRTRARILDHGLHR